MAEAKSNKVFDVSKPGKTAPSSSARPILVTNRPVLKDPMVTAESTEQKPPKEADKPLTSPSRIRIEPIHVKDDTKKDEAPAKDQAADDAAPEPDTEAEPVSDKPEKVDKAVEADEPPADTAPTETKAADTAATPDDNDHDSTNQPQKRDDLKDVKGDPNENAMAIEAQKEQERADELQKLADSHKYYLPINQVERRRNKRVMWVGIFVIVLLGLVWADVSLDAGLISIPGVKAPTHFFSN